MALPSLPSSPPGTNHPFNTEKSYIVVLESNIINITYFALKCNTEELSTSLGFLNHIIIENHVYIYMFSAPFQYNLYFFRVQLFFVYFYIFLIIYSFNLCITGLYLVFLSKMFGIILV